MRVFLILLMMSTAVLLSACNSDDDGQSVQPSEPQPNCKMHCAP